MSMHAHLATCGDRRIRRFGPLCRIPVITIGFCYGFAFPAVASPGNCLIYRRTVLNGLIQVPVYSLSHICYSPRLGRPTAAVPHSKYLI